MLRLPSRCQFLNDNGGQVKIAIFYHCVLSGPRIPSEDYAVVLLQSQMNALNDSGLSDAADEIHLGINDNNGSAILLCAFAPGKSILKIHVDGQSELATLLDLQAWLKPGWFVMYHHMKGVCYPGNPVWERWRQCMEKVCVWNWEECVDALAKGYDTVGAHWLTHNKYSMVHRSHRYWGGNFWWARSDYLMTLPPLPPDSHAARYDAEVWIGSGKQNPSVLDFAPHWPMSCPI